MPDSTRTRLPVPNKTTTPRETFIIEKKVLKTPNTTAVTKISGGVGSEGHGGSVDDGGYA